MGIKGQRPLFSHSFILLFEEERKGRVERELSGGGDHYSPPTFDGHNFHTRAPINAPFAATQNSLPPLRFYPRFE
ncbi:hypothetical protein PIB30_091272, partial [Stylosanthes scabra]|nr:hypothetical protein [Stylosanthes scabra]